MLDEIFCICLSGTGLAIGGHARWLGRAPGGGADPAGSLRGPRGGCGAPASGKGPPGGLALTTNTQRVMLVAGVAAWRVWRAEGGADPVALAGHSLGEYSALVAAGVLTLAQA